MLDDSLDNICDEVCGQIEELSLIELEFNGYVTASISAPAN